MISKIEEGGAAADTTEGSMRTQIRDVMLIVEILHAHSVSPEARRAIFQMFECNMRLLYERSSQGWNPAEKKAELFHPSSRFIILRSQEQPSDPLGFVMFRFDTEACEEDDDVARRGQDNVEVVYCYELQIADEARGKGLGRFLTKAMEHLGRTAAMRKSMLTCFIANLRARRFYENIGYVTDLICPSMYDLEDGEEEADYTIFSKSLMSKV